MAAAAAAAAAAISKRVASSIRPPAYRRVQIRPGYGQSGAAKEVSNEEILQELRRMERSLKPSGPSQGNGEVDRRLAQLEAKMDMVKLFLGCLLCVGVAAPAMVYQLQRDHTAMDNRLGIIERLLKV